MHNKCKHNSADKSYDIGEPLHIINIVQYSSIVLM